MDLPFLLILFTIPFCSTRAVGESSKFPNGTKTECAVYTKLNPCPPGHEITEECDHKNGLMKCSPCKPGMYQCDFTTTEYSVRCHTSSCPDQGKETKVKVTYYDNKTCHLSCVCNEANGYTGKSGLECHKHPHICGTDKELKNGTCVACEPGFHNPDTDYGPCVSYEPTTTSTSGSTPGDSSGPPQQGFWQIHKNWIIAIIIIIIIFCVGLAVLARYLIYRGKGHPCNIACCNGTAIQSSSNVPHYQVSTEGPPPYTSHADGDLSDGTNRHQQNGIHSASPNGIPGPNPNGMGRASPSGIAGARPNGIPGPNQNGIPGARPNDIPAARPNGIPSARPNGIPGARPNGIPSARPNGDPGPNPNGIPGARPNGIPGARPNGTPGAHDSGFADAHEDAENGLNSLTGSSISGRHTPTEDDITDHCPEWEPLTSTATSSDLPTQRLQDPEDTARKMPYQAQDSDGSDVENGNANQEAQPLLDGLDCGLVELDTERNLSHVPLVQ